MSLGQLHYTSAPPGPEGSGFRYTALTPGLPQTVLREAEQIIGYEPPRNAPARPSETELGVFPKAFSHSLLSDGSRLLARTVYIGADYSGRWGNFHAHAVHLPPGQSLPDDALPITAWDSPGWAASTPEHGVPGRLETLPASGGLDRESLIAFAKSRGPWLAGVFADLRNQAEDDAAPQVVLVERDAADVARWVALASAVLPRASAQRLTFTTYTRRPQLARQQIIGVLPDDARGLGGHGNRYRVHDCSAPPPTVLDDESNVWATTVAQIWLNGAPGLFPRAARLPGDPFAAGRPAALALCEGLALGPHGRTAAARWVREHGTALDGKDLDRLIRMLTAPGTARTPAETSSLTGLFGALNGRASTATTAPLAALVLVEAVRMPDNTSVLPHSSALTGELTRQLADELGPEVRADIARWSADGTGDPTRPVRMLHVADLLDVDCGDLLPGLARRLSRALLSDPKAGRTRQMHEALEKRRDLREALLGELDEVATDDPLAAARLLATIPLSFAGAHRPLPYLRMCAQWVAQTATGGDRVTALHAVLRASGLPGLKEPALFRAAFRLVWNDGVPTPEEARLLLGETGPAVHLGAGTWSLLVDAALNGPPGDLNADELAHELLGCFPDHLEPRRRGALLLLEFARDLRADTAGGGWADRAVELRKVAEPVEPGVVAHAYDTVTRRLLAKARPAQEMQGLIRRDDADLFAAYERAAREGSISHRLRSDPVYLADCFIDWNSHPQAGQAWSRTRIALLDDVLRPVVRALPAQGLRDVENALGAVGGRWLDEFRSWNRPGALGRLGLRFGGRNRRADGSAPRRGDRERPRRDGDAR